MLKNLRAWLNGLSDRVINEQDSEQDKLNKTMLIFACGLMSFGSILWLALYLAMGIKFSVTVPLAYLMVSAFSLGYYIYALNFEVFRTLQVSLFLFMPFIMQWSIGSYVSSSGVALWALLAPVGVMIFQGAKQSLPWFAAYIVLTVVSGFFDFFLTSGQESGVTMQGIAVFFTLNFAAMSTIMYLLISFFVRQRDKLQEAVHQQKDLLQIEQNKSEALTAEHPSCADCEAPQEITGHHRRRLCRRHRDVCGYCRIYAPVGAVAAEGGHRVAEHHFLQIRLDGRVPPSGEDQNHRRRLYGGGRAA